MEQFPSNNKLTPNDDAESAKDPKRVEKVIEGEASLRKKPLGKRMRETFISGDDARGVGTYVIFEVLIPAAKDAVSDAVSQGVERMLFGEAISQRAGRRGSITSRARERSVVNYGSFSKGAQNPREASRQRMSQQARAQHDFEEILIDTRFEADSVLEKMYEMLSKYDAVTVSDLYSLVGITSEFTDEKYGWRSLSGSRVVRVSGGYLLDLPRPEPIV